MTRISIEGGAASLLAESADDSSSASLAGAYFQKPLAGVLDHAAALPDLVVDKWDQSGVMDSLLPNSPALDRFEKRSLFILIFLGLALCSAAFWTCKLLQYRRRQAAKKWARRKRE